MAWDGLDLETARRALGPVNLREDASLPGWAGLVARALRLPLPERDGRADFSWPGGLEFLETGEPLAFEEVLVPFVLVAREDLAARAAAFEGLLAVEARRASEVVSRGETLRVRS